MATGLQFSRRRDIAVLISLALGLTGCGGGGGNSNVMGGSPAISSPSPSPSSPSPSPSGVTVTPQQETAQISETNAAAAHQAGFTGAGVTIGVVDSGIMPNNPAIAGRVTQEFIDVDPTTNNTSIPDVVGHGTWVSQIAAGVSYQNFAGGIAPGADLVSARIIDDSAPDDNGSTAPSQVTPSDATPLGQVNQQLIGAGVQVMNNSWGGITWSSTDTATTQAFDQAYAPFIEQHNGLVVFAAGNDSQANPSTIASLPTVANDPALQKGWLVAVALNSNTPTQLESYSNKCGVAMNYCLAAPGDVVVLDKDTLSTTANPTYYLVEGTSFAAPQISGAAALVWQAYPYFSNYQVQQTLLGTATPIGAQPNPTFGYGALNVGAAVNGPELLNWADVEVGFSGNSNWNNPLSGTYGVIMDGPGTLNLTQPATYNGQTVVNGGTLNAVSLSYSNSIVVNNGALNVGSITGFSATVKAGTLTTGSFSGFNTEVDGGTLAAGTISAQSNFVGTGGTLAITGNSTTATAPLINGNLSNDQGTVVVGSTNLTMTGNYLQMGGRLAVPLGSALQVTGTVTLENSPQLYVYGADSGYVVNAHTVVLSGTQGFSGTFAGVSTPSTVTLQATLGYDANQDAYLNVQQVNLTQITGLPYSAATYGAAERVQNAFNAINGTIQSGSSAQPLPSSFVGSAASIQQSQTTAALQQSLNSLSGQMYAASAAMTFEAIDADTRALSDRFDGLLDHPQQLSLNKFQSWSQNLGYQGSMSRSGYDSMGFQLNGSVIGGDYGFSNGGIVGYALSQSQGLGNVEQSADQGFSRAMEGMVYGGLVHGNWYAMGRVGVGSDWQDTRRELLLGTQTAGVSSFSNGRYDVVYSESGYRFNAGNWKFTPYADLEYANVERDGFNEAGGNGFGLDANAQSIQRWQGGFGLRASRQWIMANGTSLSLRARMLWQDSFAMHGVLPNASFAALQQFTPVEGIGLSRYGSVAGVSLDWRFSQRSHISFGLDQYSAQRENATMGTLNYSLNF
ncbi:S8 family serine peptidase [Dyella mobilis]|uniref:S8 family serine peptidase n=1 Tax=Dyella mobilis TaxID=1849582 RepID=A0ABS2KM78_9GAMM|nr:autotransporter serine protease [Dyella mobilis]MBM7131907.1 S8 family serine peptidase [Dyella mobilis]GLQ96110.1 serine protease [Dyella mobilis]